MIDRFEAYLRNLRGGAARLRWSPPDPGDSATAERQGLLLIQIDGLGFDQLDRALNEGMMPNLGKLIASEPCRVARVYAGVPSSTPAFQAELYYGQRTAVPAFSFVDRTTNRVFRMSDRDAASAVEAGLEGRALLEGGSSYSNIYRGGASVTRFSMASLGWGDFFHASRPRELPWVLATHWLDLFRTVALSAYEAVTGLPQLVAAIRRGEHVGTEIHFLQARVAVTVVLREALATVASIDLHRGLPVVHLDLLGYDEWAHRRGPSAPEAHRALRGIDRVVARLTRAARRSRHRDYEIWVLSDHGQETTNAYVELHGRPVAEAIGDVLRSHGIEHDDAPEPQRGIQGQRAGLLGARIAEALVPGLDMTPRYRDPTRATTTALGPLGHVYLPGAVDAAQLATIARQLVDVAKVPLVLAADGTDAAWAWNSSGRYRLPDQPAAVLGADHPYLTEAAADLVRVCVHPDAGTFVISGWQLDGTPLSFPHENGSHAGPGPNETSAFICAPSDAPIEWDQSALSAEHLRAAALEVLEGAAPRPSERWSRNDDAPILRILTYNVHGCLGLDGVLSPERIARVIARYEPDVVALQEVDVRRARSGGIDQAELIAERLGMLMSFHPTFDVHEEQFGDAILSRAPMRVVRRGPLPGLENHPELEPRGVLWVEVDAGSTTFQIMNTHLSIHPRERRMQVDALLGPDWVGSVDPGQPLIVCGDFNAAPGFPTCRAIGRRLTDAQVGLDGHRPRRTWGGRLPLARIDHIFFEPTLEVRHVEVPATHLTNTASDHLPLLADIAAPVGRSPASAQA